MPPRLKRRKRCPLSQPVRTRTVWATTHPQGLAAKLPLTICVEQVAASGGYLMACVADKIVAAPFAVLGSIGVITEIPNVYERLKNEGVDTLIRAIADAESREALTTAVHALDRVLRAMHIWVPQWYKGVHNIAYLDVYDRPYADTPPPYGLGVMSLWWWDEEKAAELRAEGAL